MSTSNKWCDEIFMILKRVRTMYSNSVLRFNWCEQLLLVFISVIFTFIIIRISLTIGRLGNFVGYDDIVYFLQGITLLSIYKEEGIFALLNQILREHSPFSASLAMASFYVFGTYDWAPYAGNGIIIFIMLVMINYLSRSMPFVIRLFFILFSLTIPFVGLTVHEFRPDLPTGLFTALSIVLLFLHPLAETDIKYKIIVSICFSAAILGKPSASFFTIGMMVLSTGLLVAIQIFLDWRNYKKIIISGLLHIFLPLFFVLPYYFLSFESVINYLYYVFVTDYSIWKYPSSDLLVKLNLYLRGDYGQALFGKHFYILLFSTIILTIWYFMVSRRRENITLMLFFVVFIFAWFIPSYTAFANPFFAATMYYLSLFIPLFIFHNLANKCNGFSKLQTRLIGIYGVAVCSVGLLLFKPIEFYYAKGINPVLYESTKKLVDGVYSHLAKDFQENNITNTFLYQNATGAVNHELLMYMLQQDGKRVKIHPLFSFSSNLDEWKSMVPKANYAMVCEFGSNIVNEYFPSGKIMNETLSLISNSDKFTKLTEVESYTGKHCFLFKRK